MACTSGKRKDITQSVTLLLFTLMNSFLLFSCKKLPFLIVTMYLKSHFVLQINVISALIQIQGIYKILILKVEKYFQYLYGRLVHVSFPDFAHFS